MNLPHDVEQVLIGSLLGDGCITKPPKCQNALFIESHNKRQFPYLKWKAEVLSKVFKGRIFTIEKQDQMGFRTGVSPLLTELRNKWYPNGRKTVPEKELEKLDSLGLAIWYLDDGTYSYGRNFCSLSIGDFKNQKPLLRRLFKERWGLNSSLMKSGTKSCSLYFPVEDSDKFLHLIAEHVHPSMVYKLGHIHPANNSKLKEAIQKRRERDNRLAKEYYKKNRDKILLYQRKYRRKNKEKISASFREYRSKNKSKLSERKHEYYLKNREKVLKHSREYWHRRGKFLRAERMKKVA